jgi:hypothetical protein
MATSPKDDRRGYAAVYVVALFLPFAFSFLLARPSFSTRGISFDAIPWFARISSARSPCLCFFSRVTTWSRALAMSSGERLASRPDFLPFDVVGAVGTLRAAFAFGGRPGPLRATPSVLPTSSSREAPRKAARIEDAKVEARSLRLLRSVGIAHEESAAVASGQVRRVITGTLSPKLHLERGARRCEASRDGEPWHAALLSDPMGDWGWVDFVTGGLAGAVLTQWEKKAKASHPRGSRE